MLGVGEVLQFYDNDRRFPTWGFGARVHGYVSHCFNLNTATNDSEVSFMPAEHIFWARWTYFCTIFYSLPSQPYNRNIACRFGYSMLGAVMGLLNHVWPLQFCWTWRQTGQHMNYNTTGSIHIAYIDAVSIYILLMVVFKISRSSLMLRFYLWTQVVGVEGIMSAYTSSLYSVSLAGPTMFGPVINKAADIASQSLQYSNNKYFVLLIITVCSQISSHNLKPLLVQNVIYLTIFAGRSSHWHPRNKRLHCKGIRPAIVDSHCRRWKRWFQTNGGKELP